MKNLYEVKITLVTADWGRFDGYDHILWTTNKDKAEAKAEALRKKIKATACWWMSYGKDANGDPEVIVMDVGEIED